MNNTQSRAKLVGRRAELIAELFLQDLDPVFVVRPEPSSAFDFFIAFMNSQRGINLTAVEVKSTERPVLDHFAVQRGLYDRWAHSNIPVLLLVIDVKQNRLFFARPTRNGSRSSSATATIEVRLTEIDEKTKQELRARLAG